MSRTIAAASKVTAAVRLLDALPALQPGTGDSHGCPGKLPTTLRLTYYAGPVSTHPSATAVLDTDTCLPVTLTVHEKRQPLLSTLPFPGSGLSDDELVIAKLESLLGIPLQR
jgi:hypothetical protein